MVSASALWLPIGNRDHISDPSRSPHWRFWGTLLWSVLIIIVFAITQLLVTIIQISLSTPVIYSRPQFEAALQSTVNNGNAVAYANIASTIVCCSLIYGIIKLKKGTTLKNYLCLYQIPFQTAASWSGITLGFIVLSSVILYSLGEPIIQPWMFDVYTTAQPVWVLWVALLIGAPLFEEFFFRGFMFKGMQSSFLGITGTIIITSSLFAFVHVQYDAYIMMDIWCVGVILATARQITGSLLMPLCLHTLINLGSTVEVAILHYLH